MMKDKKTKTLLILKNIAILFILIGLIIGGLNSAFGNSDNQMLQDKIRWIYLMYENIFRTIIVILSGYLSYILLKDRKKKSKMRIFSLMSFSIFMLIMLVIIPTITGVFEISIAIMPFPWSSMPLQILKDGYFFSSKIESGMIGILLIIYVIYQAVVLTGTLLNGRRFHCSMICPFSGCHAESFSLALPLLKKKSNKNNKMDKWKKNVLLYFKIFMIIFSFFIIGMMSVDVFLDKQIVSFQLLRNLEMIKYMVFEIFFLQLFYFTFTGRGYCYYCPAGTVLGLISNIAGQQIETNQSQCINCKLCDSQCEMSIVISKQAVKKDAVKDINCVGCGHCVDICPKNNLRYSTKFTRWLRRREMKETI